jgi:hypothetical protein
MTRFGTNMKLTVDRALRDDVRALYAGVLGCSVASPAPDLDVYRLEDGFNLGVSFVDAGGALRAEDQDKAAWLEFAVDDKDATVKKLDAIGVARVVYTDKTHDYFKSPGGPVFRLAGKPASS